MARPRSQLKTILEALSPNLYFQPPTNTKLVYPCIIYQLDDDQAEYADNMPYQHMDRYMLLVIDQDPDGSLRKAVRGLPMCSFIRFYTANNLNHYVYNLFF